MKSIGMIFNWLFLTGFAMVFSGCLTMAYLESSTVEQFLMHDALLIGFVSWITFIMHRRMMKEEEN